MSASALPRPQGIGRRCRPPAAVEAARGVRPAASDTASTVPLFDNGTCPLRVCTADHAPDVLLRAARTECEFGVVGLKPRVASPALPLLRLPLRPLLRSAVAAAEERLRGRSSRRPGPGTLCGRPGSCGATGHCAPRMRRVGAAAHTPFLLFGARGAELSLRVVRLYPRFATGTFEEVRIALDALLRRVMRRAETWRDWGPWLRRGNFLAERRRVVGRICPIGRRHEAGLLLLRGHGRQALLDVHWHLVLVVLLVVFGGQQRLLHGLNEAKVKAHMHIRD
mmetsp:Transcript_94714/g.203403  ORF Transcript_94714/g.203403 Transcript_94714/m.203403 type:complete len:280 (+) Transcript_94714:233-1072(+)